MISLGDLGVHVLDGRPHALAAVALTPVAQLDGLVGTRARAARHRGAPDRAGGERDLHLDRRVAPGVEDLPRDDLGDGAHGTVPLCGRVLCGSSGQSDETGMSRLPLGPGRGKGQTVRTLRRGPGTRANGCGPGTRPAVSEPIEAKDVFLNPFEDGFFDDPYAQYRRLRELRPVHQSPLGPWTLTRYEDCTRLLRDPSLSVEERHSAYNGRDAMFEAAGVERRNRGARAILNLDPPDHTRIRRLVSKAFTPRRVEALLPRVQALVDGMLDVAEGRGEIDVISDLAFPLPFAVISEMLGMPEADRLLLPRLVAHAS